MSRLRTGANVPLVPSVVVAEPPPPPVVRGIHNFEPLKCRHPPVFDDEPTLEVMRRLGIVPEDLVEPHADMLRGVPGSDRAHAKIVQQFEARRQALIVELREAREELVRTKLKKKTEDGMTTGGRSTVLNERLKAAAKREVMMLLIDRLKSDAAMEARRLREERATLNVERAKAARVQAVAASRQKLDARVSEFRSRVEKEHDELVALQNRVEAEDAMRRARQADAERQEIAKAELATRRKAEEEPRREAARLERQAREEEERLRKHDEIAGRVAEVAGRGEARKKELVQRTKSALSLRLDRHAGLWAKLEAGRSSAAEAIVGRHAIVRPRVRSDVRDATAAGRAARARLDAALEARAARLREKEEAALQREAAIMAGRATAADERAAAKWAREAIAAANVRRVERREAAMREELAARFIDHPVLVTEEERRNEELRVRRAKEAAEERRHAIESFKQLEAEGLRPDAVAFGKRFGIDLDELRQVVAQSG